MSPLVAGLVGALVGVVALTGIHFGLQEAYWQYQIFVCCAEFKNFGPLSGVPAQYAIYAAIPLGGILLGFIAAAIPYTLQASRSSSGDARLVLQTVRENYLLIGLVVVLALFTGSGFIGFLPVFLFTQVTGSSFDSVPPVAIVGIGLIGTLAVCIFVFWQAILWKIKNEAPDAIEE